MLQPKSGKKADTKSELWTVCEMVIACPGRFLSAGHRIMTYVDEIVYYESILTKGLLTYVDEVVYYESMLTKDFVLEMVSSPACRQPDTSPALQAAGYLTDIASTSPQTKQHYCLRHTLSCVEVSSSRVGWQVDVQCARRDLRAP